MRLDTIKKASKKDKSSQELAENIDFEIYNGIAESKTSVYFQ